MAVRLFIGNLSYTTTEADLRGYFSTVAPPSQVVERTAAWQHTAIHELPGADHFLAGHHREVAYRAIAFSQSILG